MDWTKYFIATVIFGISYFFIGWLVFGILLVDYTAIPEDVAAIAQYPMEEFKISLMAIACLITGALHALILMRWADVSTFTGGLKVSAVVAALITLAVGLSMASMYRMNTIDQVIINMVGDAVCAGIAGGLTGWYLGRNK